MPDQKAAKKSWRERLKDSYRLILMNNETFEEVASYQLTLLNIYTIISSLLLIVAFVVIILMAFTPLRKLIPGYADASQHPELLRLNHQIAELESQIEAQTVYINNFRKLLTGDPDIAEEGEETPAEFPDSLLNVNRIVEDELLRQEYQELPAQDLAATSVNLAATNKTLEQLYLIAPVKGNISAGYMPDKKHFGVDILAPKNSAIKSILDGVVISSDWTLETGNTITIQHQNNLISVYKHNSMLLKETGSFVQAGEAVAIIGNTGTLSSGPHLHFELWFNGKPVDPKTYINFN